MRLSGGSSSMNGRTEICYNNVWFGICADNYNNYYKRNTICGVLGYSYQGIYFTSKIIILIFCRWYWIFQFIFGLTYSTVNTI